MCGRTALHASPDDLREIFGLDDTPEVTPRYNIPPSQPLAILRAGPRRRLEHLRWGLIPWWAEDPKIGHRLSLARVETVATTAAFRDALRKRRCLVVVDGFFEWKSGGPVRQPHFIRRPDHAPFALAGLWDRWVSKDGEVVESCAILTQPALPPVDQVHGRMPLVLAKDAWDRWLDPRLDDVTALLHEGAPELVAHPVSLHVNDPRHDDPACLEPSAPAQGALF
jgi:putative SOS response-associated peptidase YedK